jgi:hypothetical protein
MVNESSINLNADADTRSLREEPPVLHIGQFRVES